MVNYSDKNFSRRSGRAKMSAWLVTTAFFLLSGCVTVNHKPMTKESSERLQSKTVTVTRYATADFGAMTPGKAALGLIGAAAMISEGNEIIKKNDIPDPAVGIGDQLLRVAQAKRSIVVVQPKAGAAATSDDIAALLTAYPGADYILDVKTINWMIGYYPTNWNGYRLIYSARVRVIEAATREVAAESLCSTVQGDDANPPTYDQLLENKAVMLKNLMEAATTKCAELIAKELLQLSS